MDKFVYVESAALLKPGVYKISKNIDPCDFWINVITRDNEDYPIMRRNTRHATPKEVTRLYYGLNEGDIVITSGPTTIGYYTNLQNRNGTIRKVLDNGNIVVFDDDECTIAIWPPTSLKKMDHCENPNSIHKNKNMRIHTKKVVLHNIKCREITKIENVIDWEHLPREYKNLPNIFWKYGANYNRTFDGIEVILKKGFCNHVDGLAFNTSIVIPYWPQNEASYMILPGDIIPEATYQMLLKIFREAGQQLYESRKNEKKVKEEEKKLKEWTGSQVDEI